MFNLILFGPPGSGKGTQSENIIKQFGFFHISTGDLLREEVKLATPLGLEAKKFIDEGQLVPDEVVIGMIGSKLDEQSKKVNGFIFDGFPRNTAQAEALDHLLEQKGVSITCLIALEVPEAELKQRLIKRGQLSGRSDDNIEVIENRILEYKSKTEPVANYYNQQGKLSTLKGNGTIEDTFNLIKQVIEEKLVK